MFKRTPGGKKRFAIGMLVLGIMLFIWFSGIKQCLTFDYIQAQSAWLHAQVEQHYLRTVLLYLASFVAVVIFCLPGAALMSILGGYLFGVFFGVLYLMIGATLGAILFFWRCAIYWVPICNNALLRDW